MIPTTVGIINDLTSSVDGSMIADVDMTDNLGYGSQKRREGNLSVLSGKSTFRYVEPSYRTGLLMPFRIEMRFAKCSTASLRTDIPLKSVRMFYERVCPSQFFLK